ncbi:hypothetical protein CRM22_001787 [Opisthorchis felineus]|uniref:Uncharacterized protein n=1 Tax=Opisthorchis felineus TaxID=147828 RepID=A0A4S2M946_OPIFE|nr:hypothetical protein CRM22_001787 [Opisthorchis felineus]
MYSRQFSLFHLYPANVILLTFPTPFPQDADEEFVVPHMDIACLQNSLAYQKVLEEPWTYLHNWNTLAPSAQQELAQNFMSTLAQLKTEMAITQGVFDPYAVSQQTTQCVIENTQPEFNSANSTPAPTSSNS